MRRFSLNPLRSARWLPEEDNASSDLGYLETQLQKLSQEPPAPPPPDVHSQH